LHHGATKSVHGRMHTTTTTKGATTMTVDEMMLIQIAAAERLEAAQRMVRVAEVRIDALVHDAPLRYKVEDSRAGRLGRGAGHRLPRRGAVADDQRLAAGLARVLASRPR